MATDKSLNLRQLKATEESAAAIVEMRQRFEAIEAQLNRIEAALAELSKPATKFQEVSRPVARK